MKTKLLVIALTLSLLFSAYLYYSTHCPFCGEELEIRYFEYSEDIAGVYCEDCNKFRYDDEWRFSEEPEWITGIEGEEYPWYGTDTKGGLMQACNGCKGIVDEGSGDPYYCSSCVSQSRRSYFCLYCGEFYRPQDGSIHMCGKCLMKHMQGTNPYTLREQNLRKEERLQIEALTRLELIIDRLKRIKEYKNEPRIQDIINEPDILALDKILEILKEKLR